MKSLLFVIATCFIAQSGFAEDDLIEIHIKNHAFVPDKILVKANERFKIKVTNEDSTSEEFESKTMIVEKFLAPKRSITITLGPLKPGNYEFFGDFHPQSAKGTLTAK